MEFFDLSEASQAKKYESFSTLLFYMIGLCTLLVVFAVLPYGSFSIGLILLYSCFINEGVLCYFGECLCKFRINDRLFQVLVSHIYTLAEMNNSTQMGEPTIS